jgi:hypothetical protein
VTFDRLVRESDRKQHANCDCGGHADYVFSAPYFKEDIMSDRWVKNRESKMKVEKKNMDRHGTYD